MKHDKIITVISFDKTFLLFPCVTTLNYCLRTHPVGAKINKWKRVCEGKKITHGRLLSDTCIVTAFILQLALQQHNNQTHNTYDCTFCHCLNVVIWIFKVKTKCKNTNSRCKDVLPKSSFDSFLAKLKMPEWTTAQRL